MIDVWGADHQGHVSRMKAAVQALGVDPARLEILIYQLVSFRRGEELVRLSKRSGNIVLIRDVVDEVGADAARFFFLSRSADSQMEFDLELAKRQSAENPVYYVQYAHARIAGILDERRRAQRLPSDDADVSLLRAPAGAGAGPQDAAAAGAGAADGEAHGAAPPAALRAGAGDGVPRVLHRVPRPRRRGQGRSRRRASRSARRRRVALARALTLMGMSTPEKM